MHIGWCVIDLKSIEKVLPSLSEIGVNKISFIYCDRSQKNFKVDFVRLERILEASMQQSGRSSFIKFDTYKNIASFIDEHKDTKVFDFFKIPSVELTNSSLINSLMKLNRHVYISLGAHDEKETELGERIADYY